MTKVKKHDTLAIGILTALILVIVVVIVVLVVLSAIPRETHTTSNKMVDTIKSLECSSSNPLDPFFANSKATEANYEIKITLSDNKPDKVNYAYTGTFESAEDTASAISNMTASYNVEMGKAGLDIGSLYPNFSELGTTGAISLYLQKDALNVNTAKFIFLSSDEYKNFSNYSSKSLQTLYEDKGFTCQINE